MNTEQEVGTTELPAARKSEEARWLTREELRSLPPIEWLVEGVIPKNANVVIYGPPAHGKSFIIDDMALSLVQEDTWQNVPIQGGPVACIVAEDAAGFSERMQAWEREHGAEARHQLHVLPEPVNFMKEGEVSRLLEDLRRMPEPPAAVFVDTLARCMVGGNENDAKDMGIYNAACERIRRETGATVITVHHSDKKGSTYRGSSSLLGAVDTMIEVNMKDETITMHCEKQKNRKEFDDKLFALIPVGDSCILGQPGVARGKITKPERQVLEVVAAAPQPLRRADIERLSGVKGGSLDRALERLVGKGGLLPEGKERTKGRVYGMTETGRELLAGVGGVTTTSGTKPVSSATPLHHCPTTAPQPNGGVIRHKTSEVPQLHQFSTTTPDHGSDTARNSTTTPPPRRGGGGVETEQVPVCPTSGAADGVMEVVMGLGLSDVGHGEAGDSGSSDAPNPSREQRLEANLHHTVQACWPQVVEELRKQRLVTTAALLAEAVPVRVDGDALVLRFQYLTLRDKFDRGGDHAERVAKVVQDVTGYRLRVQAEAAAVPPTMQ